MVLNPMITKNKELKKKIDRSSEMPEWITLTQGSRLIARPVAMATNGNKLHPNQTSYHALANSIDLSIIQKVNEAARPMDQSVGSEFNISRPALRKHWSHGPLKTEWLSEPWSQAWVTTRIQILAFMPYKRPLLGCPPYTAKAGAMLFLAWTMN